MANLDQGWGNCSHQTILRIEDNDLSMACGPWVQAFKGFRASSLNAFERLPSVEAKSYRLGSGIGCVVKVQVPGLGFRV